MGSPLLLLHAQRHNPSARPHLPSSSVLSALPRPFTTQEGARNVPGLRRNRLNASGEQVIRTRQHPRGGPFTLKILASIAMAMASPLICTRLRSVRLMC